jgi:hypothetical protein
VKYSTVGRASATLGRSLAVVAIVGAPALMSGGCARNREWVTLQLRYADGHSPGAGFFVDATLPHKLRPFTPVVEGRTDTQGLLELRPEKKASFHVRITSAFPVGPYSSNREPWPAGEGWTAWHDAARQFEDVPPLQIRYRVGRLTEAGYHEDTDGLSLP